TRRLTMGFFSLRHPWKYGTGRRAPGRGCRSPVRKCALDLELLERRLMLYGTPALLADINPGADGSDPRNFPEVHGKVFCVASDSAHGEELWMTDGTTTGTALVKDIRPGNAGSVPVSLTSVGDRLFFTAIDGAHGRELWTSDGTEAGTTIVANINADE